MWINYLHISKHVEKWKVFSFALGKAFSYFCFPLLLFLPKNALKVIHIFGGKLFISLCGKYVKIKLQL
jgi:hypothetical protein